MNKSGGLCLRDGFTCVGVGPLVEKALHFLKRSSLHGGNQVGPVRLLGHHVCLPGNNKETQREKRRTGRP
jgi:hypothetical protein